MSICPCWAYRQWQDASLPGGDGHACRVTAAHDEIDTSYTNLHGTEPRAADDLGLATGAQAHGLQAIAHAVRRMDSGYEGRLALAEVC